MYSTVSTATFHRANIGSAIKKSDTRLVKALAAASQAKEHLWFFTSRDKQWIDTSRYFYYVRRGIYTISCVVSRPCLKVAIEEQWETVFTQEQDMAILNENIAEKKIYIKNEVSVSYSH